MLESITNFLMRVSVLVQGDGVRMTQLVPQAETATLEARDQNVAR